jgi:antitoxin component of MazEF toxin-antitoxin module
MELSKMESSKLELSIGKWGNSLALRIPADVARMMRVVEGSKLSFELDASSGCAVLQKPKSSNGDLKRHFADVRSYTSKIPTTPNSVRLMRDTDRY